MFSTLLIADRGEVVMRIARTCERMGIRTLAAHDAVETGASYLTACDEVLPLANSSSGAIDTAALIAAAKEKGAEAIHPGSGALARDANFARAVREAGLVFVGAAPEVLERLADDLAYVELARQAGVRPLAACRVDATKLEDVLALAFEVDYPLLVGDAARAVEPVLVCADDELAEALAGVRDAAGKDSLRLEHHLDRPRMLSVAVVADGIDAIALSDAEHSVAVGTRRVLEEAPAPALSGAAGERQRLALRESAVRAAVEAGITGLATVEFQLDASHRLYLVGLRAGLVLEHGLAEMCTRLDLVELQLRIASGERLPADALRVQQTGCAIQARIYAGDPIESASVELSALRWPMLAPGRLRVDSDLVLGMRPAVEIDPLVARVIGYGPTRHQALLTLDRALAECTVEPLQTNLQLIRDVLGDESFRAGQFDCEFAARLAAQPPAAANPSG